MSEEEQKDINNLIYTLEIHHISSKPIQDLLNLYNKEKEKNKELEKQLQDIHDNFCKFNWKESNGKQVYILSIKRII